MADVFISYSRKDKAFVQRLDEALRQRERKAWVDWEGIRPTEEFMLAIYAAIEGADTFIFVLSPDSIASAVCAKEIAHAVASNKRLVPLVARDLGSGKVPEALAKLNWIFCRDSDDFTAKTDELISALDTDLDWVRMHTRLLMRAVEWKAKGKNNSFVLRGVDLTAAERWLSQATTDKERQPTVGQTEYIIASRRAAVRRQRITVGSIVFGLLVAAVLGIVGWLQYSRVKNNTSHSEFLRAAAWLDANDAAEALRSLAKALEWNPSNTEAATQLISLLGQRRWPHQMAGERQPFRIDFMERSADERSIFAASGQSFGAGDPQLALLDRATLRGGSPITLTNMGVLRSLTVNHAGSQLLASGLAQTTLIDTGKRTVVKNITTDLPEEFGSWFSLDGKWALVWKSVNSLEGAEKPESENPAAFWLSIVNTRDGTPHPAVAGFPLPNRPIAACMFAGEVRVLDAERGVTIQQLKKGAASEMLTLPDTESLKGAESAQFSPDGARLIAAGPKKLAMWGSPVSGRPEGSANAPDSWSPGASHDFPNIGANSLAFRFDGPRDFTVTASGGVRGSRSSFALQLRSDPWQEKEWSGKFAPVCALSPGLAVARDTLAFVIPFSGGTYSGPLRHKSRITAMCALKDGSIVTGSADGELKLWQFARAAFAPSVQPEASGGEVRRLLSRSREGVKVPVELWAEAPMKPALTVPPTGDPDSASDAQNTSASAEDKLVVIRAGERRTVDLGSPPVVRKLSTAMLAPDGRRGVFCGEVVDREEYLGPAEVFGAWVFSVDDPGKPSVAFKDCAWAGFTPDGRQVLTVRDGQLVFWEDGPVDADGRATFRATGQILPQAGMTSAVLNDAGTHLATWSQAGEVVVWETARWGLVQRFDADPLWNTDGESDCPPALSHDGRRLATAFNGIFVIWDVATGRRVSDPISCPGKIERLAFIGTDASQVEATMQAGNGGPRNTLRWSYADTPKLSADAEILSLRELAEMVAKGDWVEKAPALAAKAESGPGVVTTLLEHFAEQARFFKASRTPPTP